MLGPHHRPSNRRLRFSLRTLFVVVTVAALLLGWIVYRVRSARERDEAIEHLAKYRMMNTNFEIPAKTPWFTKLTGDKVYLVIAWIVLDESDAAIAEELRSIFPEAQITPMDEVQFREYRERVTGMPVPQRGFEYPRQAQPVPSFRARLP